MKCAGFVLLLGVISLGAIGGCNNNNGEQGGTRALTENDFSEDTSISARADRGVVVKFLEPPGGDQPESDTGEVGIDLIPYRYNQTFEHTICWEDDDPGAAHFMTLVDSSGEEVLMLGVNGDCVTEIIEEGNYEMRLHHDGASGDTHPIFIQPLLGDQEARNNSTEPGIIKTVKRIFEESLHGIGISTDARAQTVQQNIQTLLKTGSCNNCNLEKANLKGAKLFEADLTEANLMQANLSMANLNATTLTNSNLTGANLFEADLTGADLTGANLFEADLNATTLINLNLTDANLTGATLIAANLMQANLSMANLTNASLLGAELIGANLIDVTLSSTTFDSARWCDGSCTCGASSIDTCVGCPSIDTCTGS
jgi:Pentapeptide repeats (8 copies)